MRKPRRYDKKPVKFDPGLDVLNVWRGTSRKTIGKTNQHEDNTVNNKTSRSYFRIRNTFIPFWGVLKFERVVNPV